MFYTRRSTYKCTLHILWWTSAVLLHVAWCRSRSRGCALYRDASRAAYVLGPPPARGGDLKLGGGVNVSLWKYGVVHGTLTWSGVWMSLLDKQEVQDICGYTALRAKKWSRFICKRAVRRYDTIALGLLKKEELEEELEKRRRRMPNSDFFYFARCVHKLALYSNVIYLFDCKSAVEDDGGV